MFVKVKTIVRIVIIRLFMMDYQKFVYQVPNNVQCITKLLVLILNVLTTVIQKLILFINKMMDHMNVNQNQFVNKIINS